MTRPFCWDRFWQMPVVGIIRHLEPDELTSVLPIFRQSGLTTLEITMNTPGAASMIQQALRQFPDVLNIGAGTVRTLAALEESLAAGAQFIVTPVLDEEIVLKCVEAGVPVFPGAYSPTEIQRAWRLGASLVKIYPAGTLGPGFIRDVKAPLEEIKLLPTGGIGLENIRAFLEAGADGVGMGSQLFDKALIRARDWPGLEAHFRAVAGAVRRNPAPPESLSQ